MKPRNLIAALIIMASLTAVSAMASEKSIDAPIGMVTVYPDRAQITRFAHLNLLPGEYALLIENLPVTAIDGSFRASVSNIEGLTLLGLNHRLIQHLEAPQQKVAELERQIELIERIEKQAKLDRLEAFKEQKSLLIRLSQSAGQWTSGDSNKIQIDVSQWNAAFGFIGGRLLDVGDSIRIVSNQLNEIEKRLAKLKADLNSLKGSGQRATKTVSIDVILDKDAEFDLALKYVATGASWTPVYDARLNGNEEVNLNCFADVSQHTGEDWNNVDLTISTAQPSRGTGPGLFSPWYLSIIEYGTYPNEADYLLKKAPSVVKLEEGEMQIRGGRDEEKSFLADGFNLGTDAAVGTTAYSITFKAKHKKSILSGEESVRTLIAGWNLESELTYLSRPKNRQEVYRLANITNQNEAPLMPGKVSIFADSDFLGTTNIREFIAPGEEFELPFGADDNFKVKREMLAQKKGDKTGFLGQDTDKKQIKQTIKITLTNNGTSSRTVQLEEPLPVSQDDRVKVKLGDIAPEYDKKDEQGKAEWSIVLAPGEEKEIIIPYKIEFPEGMQIAGL